MSCDLEDTDRLRQKMLASKVFLVTLYKHGIKKERQDVVNTIMFAQEDQLATLICILHKISKQIIPIPKRESRRVYRSKREHLLQKLKNSKFVNEMLEKSRKEIVVFLTKFSYLYGIFLYYLFHEK